MEIALIDSLQASKKKHSEHQKFMQQEYIMIIKSISYALFGVATLMASAAGAVTIDVTATDPDMRFTLSSLPSVDPDVVSGISSGSGNPGASSFSGYTLIDKSDDNKGPLGEGSLVFFSKKTGGVWSLNSSKLPSGYSDFAILLKSATGWAFFDLNDATSGTWKVEEWQKAVGHTESYWKNKKLSHASLYGKPSAVPLPAAAYLFGSALLGMAGIGYRRNKKQA